MAGRAPERDGPPLPSSPPPLPARPHSSGNPQATINESPPPSAQASPSLPVPPLRALNRLGAERKGPAATESLLALHRSSATAISAATATADHVLTLSAAAISGWCVHSGDSLWSNAMGLDAPVCCVAFAAHRALVGTRSGQALVVELATGRVVKRMAVSSRPILHVLSFRGQQVLAIDSDGWVHGWRIRDGGDSIYAEDKTGAARVMEGAAVAHLAPNGALWMARGTIIEVHQLAEGQLALLARFDYVQDLDLGGLTAAAITSIASVGERVVCGHQDGTLSRWDACAGTPIDCHTSGSHRITALAGGLGAVWAALSTGKLMILDADTMHVLNEWKAHPTAIVLLARAVLPAGRLAAPLISICDSGSLQAWDAYNLGRLISLRLRQRGREYCQTGTIVCRVASWNVDSQRPPGEGESSFWHKWLGLDGPADILVVGLQEVIDLQSKSSNAKILLNSGSGGKGAVQPDEARSLVWIERLQGVLARSGLEGFSLLAKESMVGLMLAVFVRERIRDRVRYVHQAQVKTGLAGLHGNKGALVCRLVVDDSSVCLVNCHLAAGHSQAAARQVDLNTITRSARLRPLAVPDGVFSGGSGDLISDHEHCILFGDLNYRLELSRPEAEGALRAGALPLLLQRDQLGEQLEAVLDHPLAAFREAPIRFAPTYKYDRGTRALDSSEKQRVPAYCDRILLRSEDAATTILSYDAIDDMLLSDHRPVCATIQLAIKAIDRSKQALVRLKVEEELVSRIIDGGEG